MDSGPRPAPLPSLSLSLSQKDDTLEEREIDEKERDAPRRARRMWRLKAGTHLALEHVVEHVHAGDALGADRLAQRRAHACEIAHTTKMHTG